MTWSRRDALAVLFPLALALVVFLHVTAFPFVNWDDPSHFLENPLAAHPLERGLTGLFWTREIGYPAPALLLSFALDRVLFGLSPGPYHAENVAFHLANVALLYWIARRVGLSRRQACGAATLFAIHPLAVEPVAWVTGRKDVLATFLLFVATIVAAGPPDNVAFSRTYRWVAANVLAVLSVLVLPRSVVAPLLIALLVSAMRPTWPKLRVALAMAPALPFAVAVVVLGSRQLTDLGAFPRRHFGEVVSDVAGAWSLQLFHVLWPFDLLTYYFREPGDPSLMAMVFAAVVAAFAGLYVALQKSPESGPVRTGLLLMAIAYAPVSSFVRIVRWTADSYMYLPLAGVGIAAAALIGRAWPPRLASFGTAAGITLALVLSLVAWTTSYRFHSSSELWAGSIARYPDQPLSYEHEALGLLADGRIDEANRIFRELSIRFPDWSDNFDDEFRAYLADGDATRAGQRLAKGVEHHDAACLRIFWTRLLAGEAGTPDPTLLAEAFRGGFPAMKGGLHQPGQFRRAAVILRAAGLSDDARQADAQADALERAPRGP